MDGGPTFLQTTHDPWNKVWTTGGMSLRDWFAGQALVGLSAKYGEDSATLAKMSYEHADAILKARKEAVSDD